MDKQKNAHLNVVEINNADRARVRTKIQIKDKLT